LNENSSVSHSGLVPLNNSALTFFEKNSKIDVVFPVLHGPYGEDGSIQGLLKVLDVPFVGSGVLGSAIGMDKDVMKRLLRDAKIPVAKFITLNSQKEANFALLRRELKTPFFIKPANLGSSIGVHKIFNKKDFEKLIKNSFSYDKKILAEEFIKGREIECSILGGQEPICSVPGEVIPHDEFYSYNSKYVDENGAKLVIPANLPQKTTKKIQELALESFVILGCEHMARVDFFVTKKGKILVNEVNTIPGFTNISMYPKLFEVSGISQSLLIKKLIEFSIERYKKEKSLKTSYKT
jgi:D-alanine-D-alanine ligase